MEYFSMISSKHFEKLKKIAENRGVDLDTALKAIVTQVNEDNYFQSKVPEYFREIFKIYEIEEIIDFIAKLDDKI